MLRPWPAILALGHRAGNTTFSQSFGRPSADPELARVLVSKGALLRDYYGIGHDSLDNYIAEVSPWKSYNQQMGNDPARDGTTATAHGPACGHPKLGTIDQTDVTGPAHDSYATRHNPFV
jgi:phosphatidylinositol-3-phosphatase